MQRAEAAVKDFLGKKNHHSVDIEQETAPAVVHERVVQKQHENVTTALDREVHQHHHQTHVQPIQDQVLESEKHHHNVIPIEHRESRHNKDREVEAQLQEHRGNFRDEREVLPVETTNSSRNLVGEHVHHHIHDVIQPVVERETIQPHVVHTTVPIHERIENEPVVHKGNVLPTLSMNEFNKAGHSLTGYKKDPEHIEYEGDPLNIDGKSHVGFGGVGGNREGGVGNESSYTTGSGTTGTGMTGNSGIGNNSSSYGNETTPRNAETTSQSGTGSGIVHNSSLLNKLDPRVDAAAVERQAMDRT